MFTSHNKQLVSIALKSDVFRTLCQKAPKGKLGVAKNTPRNVHGQPTHETHPNIIANGEITPLIKRSEFQERRQILMEQIMSYVKGRNPDVTQHLIVVPSATKQFMSDNIPYFFRQNTDFLYLTGCQEPDSCLVLAASNSSGQHCSTMFVREKDDHSEMWDGPRTGPDNAPNLFGVDQSLPTSELGNYLHSYRKSNKAFSLWYDYTTPILSSVHKVMCDYLNEMQQKLWESPKMFVQKQRLIKSPAEIALMQQSCDVASDAIVNTIRSTCPGSSESQIFARVHYECLMNGAEHLAYPPVIAGGDRATVIHYIDNNQIVQDGDMVLMDAGCEYHGYSSDVTRTWPVNGQFTREQRVLYEIVLDVQDKLVELCHALPTLDSLFDSMCVLLGRRLQEVGLISKVLTKEALHKAAYQFCPHHVSHYLGMDVHDTPLITRNIKMKPGMIITVEPGIYISKKFQQVPKEFLGLGVRIEDDVLITESGPVVLTRNCPKEVDDIEKLSSQV